MSDKRIPTFKVESGLFICGIRWSVVMDGVLVAQNLKTEEDANFEAEKFRRVYIAGQANISLDRLYMNKDRQYIDCETDLVIA